MEVLKKIYYDVEQGYISKEKLYKKAKKEDSTITRKKVEEFLSKQKINQVFGRQKKYYNSFIVHEPLIQWQMDVGFFKDKPFFFLIDVFSKKGFARLMKNESAEEVVRLLKEAIKENGKPKTIYSDDGSNFTSSITKNFLENEDIRQILAGGRHAAFVEVFIKTIKGIMEKAYKNITTNLSALVKAVVKNYNNTEHSTIGMEPNEVKPENYEEVHNRIIEKAKVIPSHKQLRPGDNVRVKIEKETFDKGYLIKFSKKIYEIELKKGQRYKLKDKEGLFFNSQLKRVETPDEIEEETEEDKPKKKKRIISRRDKKKLLEQANRYMEMG